MPPTRKIIAEFIGVFLIGAIAGGFVTWRSYTDTQLSMFMNRTSDPDSLAARIEKKYVDEYHLTPDEVNRIQPIIMEMSQHIYQVRHKFGVDVISTLDDYHQRIAAQLTPNHRAIYEKSVSDRKAKLTSMLLPDQGSPNGGGK
jgi:hypothetical protein